MAGRAAVSTKTTTVRRLSVGIAATLLLSVSPVALHAETSNAELAKEIAELKAQIHAMRGAIAENRTETRRVAKRAPATVIAGAPAAYPALPAGATPVFVTASKQMQFGSLTITPGGFVDMYGIYRSKNLGADTNSPLNAIPTLSSNNAHVSEGRLSARNTRVALLVESPISANMIVAGYGELDFRASGTTSSPGQTNNFVPRVRQLYSTLDNNEWGVHFLAGQAWSLVTANSKGITPRNELTPPTLDNVVLPGFDYSRTPQIRLTKDFDKKLWLSISAENPQTGGLTNGACNSSVSNTPTVGTTIAGAASPIAGAVTAVTSPVSATNISANAATGVANGTCVTASGASTDFGGTGTAQNITLNKVPNIIGKVAYEARIADRDVHVEALGMFKLGTTYVDYGAAGVAPNAITGYAGSGQQNTPMGGVGGNISFPVVPGKLDLQAGGDYGTGFGYYTSTGLPDATVGADGRIKGIKIISGYAGLVGHVTPAIDVYAFAGIDQAQRTYTQIGTAQVGYGITNGVNNTGCYAVGGTCAGATHRVWQITGGFSDKIYKGSFGEVRASAQYSYTRRDLFSGTTSATGPTAAAPLVGASTSEHIVMTSLRYYPFQ